MISLLNLMLLLGKSVVKGPGTPAKLPDAEYIDIGINPTMLVSKVYYKSPYTTENLVLGVSPTLLITRVYHKNRFTLENVTVGINPIMIVTKTGANPL